MLAAARDLLQDSGLAGLSMRALARRLDVAPNTLYSHVASKTALVDDVLDAVLAEVAAPDPRAADPLAAIAAVMTSTFEVLLEHPDLVSLYLARQGAAGPVATALGDGLVDLLGRGGVHGAPAREALRVLIVFTIGFAAFASQARVPGSLRRRPDVDLRETFERGLAWLLQGIVATAVSRRR